MHYIVKNFFAIWLLVVLGYLAIWTSAIIFGQGEQKVQFVFGFIICTLAVIIPPIWIFYDSYEKEKDASSLVLISLFINYFAIIIYIINRKSLPANRFVEKS